MPPFANASELIIDEEWDTACNIVSSGEEIPVSCNEVCKVLEEWTSDEESGGVDIMEVDEDIGENFFLDDLFYGITSPALQDRFHIDFDMSSDDFLSLPSDETVNPKHAKAFSKLSESMRRSQESRLALTMKTYHTADEYSRRKSVDEVLDSIRKSTAVVSARHYSTPWHSASKSTC